MDSGHRLDQAIVAAEADSIEAPHCPQAASTKAESANVMASDAEWVANRNKHWLQVMVEHTVARDWSYVQEVEGKMP